MHLGGGAKGTGAEDYSSVSWSKTNVLVRRDFPTVSLPTKGVKESVRADVNSQTACGQKKLGQPVPGGHPEQLHRTKQSDQLARGEEPEQTDRIQRLTSRLKGSRSNQTNHWVDLIVFLVAGTGGL